ncbi:TetR/AcrR family transcriptional regulator [Saccharibacillus sacchari]|uniref:TetR/AcrR family transcriptional regulator n=1 Tax=Saccharibacillus sacchari TaxID=456493 RepID=UPI0004ADE0B5|nr:TetR/AcrR family transcriptional regulator [Saccharibacillus sacchari]
MKKPNKNSKKELILEAAAAVINEQGVEKMTLEAVAKKAGVSKGGLLYHFPGKQELIEGLVESLTTGFTVQLNREAESEGDQAGKWGRAYVRATFGTEEELEWSHMLAAFPAAMFTDPKLLDQVRVQYEEWQKLLENDGVDPVKATILRLAVDGLWYAELFRLAPPNAELRRKVRDELMRWTEVAKGEYLSDADSESTRKRKKE